ncbi:MarR family transcriptional regulator [bacterium]|nr:MarR family transcriptional regulator [bacterium]
MPLTNQVERFHRQIVELIKKYQFRDRGQISCCGISVSQCYVLETLNSHGPLTANELAEKMYLKISTVTRVVDQLVKKNYVTREEGDQDRRVRVIKLTRDGEAVFQESWRNVFQSEKTILENFPEQHRELLIDFLKKLNGAVDQWHACCR